MIPLAPGPPGPFPAPSPLLPVVVTSLVGPFAFASQVDKATAGEHPDHQQKHADHFHGTLLETHFACN